MSDPAPAPSAEMTARPADGTATCPGCDAPVGSADAFCESCGATLRTDAVAAAPGALSVVSPADPTASHLVTAPDPASPSSGAPSACILCGNEVLDDGFCGTCGAKARTPRDHWTEIPAADLAGVCDKGISHARNEDAMALAVGGGADQFGDNRRIILVCDGVTSAPDSDIASLAACRAAVDSLLSASVAPEGAAGSATHWTKQLRVACAAANAAAVAVARSLGDPPEPPSCTFVAAVAIPPTEETLDRSTFIAVAWCGDSRAYWFGDDGDARQLGLDHSLGTEMIKAGATIAEAEANPTSHTITRWLGADSYDPTPETLTMMTSSPGWLAVVSDGMWNYASSPGELGLVMMRAVADLGAAASPVSISESMTAWANDRGGHDNITVALHRVGPPITTASTTAVATTPAPPATAPLPTAPLPTASLRTAPPTTTPPPR